MTKQKKGLGMIKTFDQLASAIVKATSDAIAIVRQEALTLRSEIEKDLEEHASLDTARFEQVGEKLDAMCAEIRKTSIRTESNLNDHTKLEDRRFISMEGKLIEVAADVKSLLASRSYTRGMWRAVGVIAGVLGGLVSLVVSIGIAVLRGK